MLPDLGDLTDLRLLALDMDGTLLDDAKRIGAGFDALYDALRARGVTVVAASGRQYATLHRALDRPGLVYVAENGAWVLRDDVPLSGDGLDPVAARRGVDLARAHVASGADAGLVLCGRESAWIERADDAFLDVARPYYARLRVVDDLLTVHDDVLKLALYDFASSASAVPAFAPLDGVARTVVSGPHWLDVGSPTADKGAALGVVQRLLGVGPEHTMAFGDYLNDLGMLRAARWSVAMANAHPEVLRAARFEAPSNNDNGVVRTLAAALDLTL